MREFPNITVPEPSWLPWLWLVIPIVAAIVFLVGEFIVQKVSAKRRKSGHPFVGWGFIPMGIAIFVATMTYPLVPLQLEEEKTAIVVQQLEESGFEEVRISIENGTFGAYYDGELMRGALVPVQNHEGEFRVIETPPPS